MPEKKTDNISFRCTETRHEELKILAARRRQSIQVMIEDALVMLEGAPITPASKKPDRYLGMLEVVLVKASKKDADFVRRTLEHLSGKANG